MRRTALFISIVMALLLPMSTAMAKTVLGNAKANTLRGTSDMDLIKGRGGRDDIRGRAHRDKVKGGTGRDVVYGMKGADVVVGGTQADDLYGGSGNDKIRSAGDADPDQVFCDHGRDDKATIGSGDAVDNQQVTTSNIAFVSGDTSCETITLVLNDGTRVTASNGMLR
ncbi:MAG: hypothetical protein M3N17_03210 [Actinomycetota bacterium]|nr:hypothetical protein [Actinomycetota bacterium]